MAQGGSYCHARPARAAHRGHPVAVRIAHALRGLPVMASGWLCPPEMPRDTHFAGFSGISPGERGGRRVLKGPLWAFRGPLRALPEVASGAESPAGCPTLLPPGAAAWGGKHHCHQFLKAP